MAKKHTNWRDWQVKALLVIGLWVMVYPVIAWGEVLLYGYEAEVGLVSGVILLITAVLAVIECFLFLWLLFTED